MVHSWLILNRLCLGVTYTCGATLRSDGATAYLVGISRECGERYCPGLEYTGDTWHKQSVFFRHGKRCGRVDIVHGNFLVLWKYLDCVRIFTLIKFFLNVKISSYILNIWLFCSLWMMIFSIILVTCQNFEKFNWGYFNVRGRIETFSMSEFSYSLVFAKLSQSQSLS